MNNDSLHQLVAALRDPMRKISIQPSTRFVYMLFQGDEVVYVGFTAQIGQRIGTHKSGITRITFDSYSFVAFNDHAEAINAERALIDHLRPRYNKSIPLREYEGTPEARKTEEAEKFKAARVRRAERMARNLKKSEEWFARLPEWRQAEITQQKQEFAAHCARVIAEGRQS